MSKDYYGNESATFKAVLSVFIFQGVEKLMKDNEM